MRPLRNNWPDCQPFNKGLIQPEATTIPAQVIVVANEALEPTPPEVSLHTGVARDPLVTRHVDKVLADLVLLGDVGGAGGDTPGTQGPCPSIDPAPRHLFSEMVQKFDAKEKSAQLPVKMHRSIECQSQKLSIGKSSTLPRLPCDSQEGRILVKWGIGGSSSAILLDHAVTSQLRAHMPRFSTRALAGYPPLKLQNIVHIYHLLHQENINIRAQAN